MSGTNLRRIKRTLKPLMAQAPLDKNVVSRLVGRLSAHVEAYKSFVRKWSKDLPKVVRSLEKAGEELLTFYAFPKAQWKSLKTTNPIERLNLEFKRRVKTQCSLPSEKLAILLLYGLLLSGQIRFRKIDGWRTIVQVLGAMKEGLKKQAS